MKTSSDYRAMARETLCGRWNESALLMLILFAVVCIFDLPAIFLPQDLLWVSMMGNGVSVVLVIFLLYPLIYALLNAYLSLTRGESGSLIEATWRFFINDYTRSLPTMLLMMLAIGGLGIITLGIGAIILNFAYAMTPYLLRDYPELTATEALRTSRQMMRGHKWDLFVLELSFIGWALLSVFTLGIGALWLGGYIYTAQAHFYEDLKAETIVEDED